MKAADIAFCTFIGSVLLYVGWSIGAPLCVVVGSLYLTMAVTEAWFQWRARRARR